MTAEQILEKLKLRYALPRYVAFDELRVATGYTRGEQRIDFWAMDCWPSRCYARYGFEIKVSRADFSRELRQPEKRRPTLMLCNRFFFAAPVGVVPIDKLPVDAGLVEFADNGIRRVTVEAPWIDTEPATWGFVAALMRRMADKELPR